MAETSNFNPLALTALVALMYLTWSLPRRFAVCPLLAMICLMPLGQELVLLGFHFFLFRILLLVGLVRVIAKGEVKRVSWTRTDKIFKWWVIVSVVFGTMANPSMDLLRNRLGDAYNAAGCYIFVRSVVVDFEDVLISVRALIILSLPLAVLMLVEKTTTHNLLSVFGGVPAITNIREGQLRCQGSFRHPILAGCFGASLVPLAAGLWPHSRRDQRLALGAGISGALIVVLASSTGAVVALISSLAGLALWKWRTHMRLIRRATVAVILGMALVMKAPVWYLFAHLSTVAGGTGWHRAYLIDQFIGHFGDWWLFGTTYTANWAPGGEVTIGDPNMMDITNHYITQAVTGGLLKLVLFVSLIVAAFKMVGRRVEVEPAGSRAAFFVWATGVSLFTHCLSFMSATYFDQTIIVYYWLLAIICCLGSKIAETAPQDEAQEARIAVPV